MGSKKQKCIRCEALERRQQSRIIYSVTNSIGDTIPICAKCLGELKDEEDFFKIMDQTLEEDELGSEGFD
jgi:hypothetical protein